MGRCGVIGCGIGIPSQLRSIIFICNHNATVFMTIIWQNGLQLNSSLNIAYMDISVVFILDAGTKGQVEKSSSKFDKKRRKLVHSKLFGAFVNRFWPLNQVAVGPSEEQLDRGTEDALIWRFRQVWTNAQNMFISYRHFLETSPLLARILHGIARSWIQRNPGQIILNRVSRLNIQICVTCDTFFKHFWEPRRLDHLTRHTSFSILSWFHCMTPATFNGNFQTCLFLSSSSSTFIWIPDHWQFIVANWNKAHLHTLEVAPSNNKL